MANKKNHSRTLKRLFYPTDEREIIRIIEEKREELRKELGIEIDECEPVESPNFDPNTSGEYEFEGIRYTSGAPLFWLSDTGKALMIRRKIEKENGKSLQSAE